LAEPKPAPFPRTNALSFVSERGKPGALDISTLSKLGQQMFHDAEVVRAHIKPGAWSLRTYHGVPAFLAGGLRTGNHGVHLHEEH
jgi:hypothetical protein